jgi:hypothetical protein
MDNAAGVIPEMRAASARLAGLRRESFSITSPDSPDTTRKSNPSGMRRVSSRRNLSRSRSWRSMYPP